MVNTRTKRQTTSSPMTAEALSAARKELEAAKASPCPIERICMKPYVVGDKLKTHSCRNDAR